MTTQIEARHFSVSIRIENPSNCQIYFLRCRYELEEVSIKFPHFAKENLLMEDKQECERPSSFYFQLSMSSWRAAEWFITS